VVVSRREGEGAPTGCDRPIAGIDRQPIAVIGIGCRFPGGVHDPESLWRLLAEGSDAIREVPPDRWKVDDLFDPDPAAPGKMNTRWGGFLDRVDEFDADFFGISPREAIRVDPQHRLLLEVSWEALENAGLPRPAIARSRAGVFVGVIGSDYALLQLRDRAGMDPFSGTGSTHSILANRVSYVLDLTGPSLALDTACSSSLVALHLACQSLRRGESDLALAGGVNLILSPEMTLALTKAHMMSPDGRCKAFDASANGYVRGEGCGVVVLKRLAEAEADGNRILAVVRGSAVNHDGRSNGLSAPSGPAQEAVIRAALEDAGVAPWEIGYVEAHGTGTRLGDPIEVEALLATLAKGRPLSLPLRIGSIKTNIGHLESAAGVAGLLKAILVLRRGIVPPHLHLRTRNPLVPIDGTAVTIPTEPTPWPRGDAPRRAGVSSFGFGGTNAHVILEEPPEPTRAPRGADGDFHLVALSARSPEALSELAGRYADWLARNPATPLDGIASTTTTGRTHFPFRAAVVVDSCERLATELGRLASGEAGSRTRRGSFRPGRPPRVAFLFTGQGAQQAGMGRRLHDTEPVFRRAFDRCAEILEGELDPPLLSLLEPANGPLLDETRYAQPALFAIEYALTELWRHWGVRPAAMLGHSLGEIVAATVAGSCSLEEGLRFVAERGRLMQALSPGGRMATIFATPEQLAPFLDGGDRSLAIAARNSPDSLVVSGGEAPLGALLARLREGGVRSKGLATSHAFHSPLVEPMLGELRRAAAKVAWSSPAIPVASNVTGRMVGPGDYADPDYWVRHSRSTVLFAEGVRALENLGCSVFLEIGPAPTLAPLAERCIAGGDSLFVTSLRPGWDDRRALLDAVAQLHVRGTEIDWLALQGGDRSVPLELPTYPFHRKRHWFTIPEPQAPEENLPSSPENPTGDPLLGRRIVAATAERIFESRFSANRPALLADHRIQGETIVPAAVWLEIALAASSRSGTAPGSVVDAFFAAPLLLGPSPTRVQTLLSPAEGGGGSFRIVSAIEGEGEPLFVTHASGRFEEDRPGESPGRVDVANLLGSFRGQPRDSAWRDEALRRSGLEMGPSFCWAETIWIDGERGLARLRPPGEADGGDLSVHPGLLDTAFQLLGATLPGAGTGIAPSIPLRVERLRLHRSPRGAAWCLATRRSNEGGLAVGDVSFLDEEGGVLLDAEGVQLRQIPRDWLGGKAAPPSREWLHELAWVESPLEEPAPPRGDDEERGSDGVLASGRSGFVALVGGRGRTDALEAHLRAAGEEVCVIDAALPPERRRELLQERLSRTDLPPIRGVVHLATPDGDPPAGEETPDFVAARDRGWGAVLDLVQELAESGGAAPPPLWLVTSGAQHVPGRRSPLRLDQAPIWGLGRVVATEHPELRCTLVDLDPCDPVSGAERLARELLVPGRESQVAFVGPTRFVARLRPIGRSDGSRLEPPVDRPWRLEIEARGALDRIGIRPFERQPPVAGAVEIAVRAAGINFRDVLNLLGLYPGDPGPLGGECAGEVVAVGEGVTEFRPGDRVVALAPATFASHATTLAELTAPLPEGVGFAEGAALPIARVTARLALREIAAIRPGERVLVHSAAGGVGSAAIEVARRAGARILATAGSESKRERLRLLGIETVMDSRSLDFVRESREATHGEGVDVVLNSLTGEAIPASLSLLRAGGRFVELGKTDLWDQARVESLYPGVRFHRVALDSLMRSDPALVGRLLREVVGDAAAGRLPPLPFEEVPLSGLVGAFRRMARGEQVGKAVARISGEERPMASPAGPSGERTWLVTGALGGLGRKLARWIVDRGGRHLVLVGRHADEGSVPEELAELSRRGATIVVRRCDVSRREEVATLLREIDERMPPLGSVFHLAGELDDAPLREQSRDRFDRVLAGKMMGAWHLHDLCRGRSPDRFVLFSSVAALLGSPGQGSYAAANAFLDLLAEERRRQGGHALSIGWGPFAGAGMAAGLADLQGRRWSAAGIGWIDPEEGMRTLDRLLDEDRTAAAVLAIDWSRFLGRIPAGLEPPLLDEIRHDRNGGTTAQQERSARLLEKLEGANPGERLEVALAFVREEAALVLGLDAGELPDPRRLVLELGFDSLTAVELCNRIGVAIGRPIHPAALFDHPTLEAITGHVVRDLLKLDTGDPAPSSGGSSSGAAPSGRALEEVEGMTDEELNALVTRQIERRDR
jgi:acyl transferase domain-containing protein/NADPH:quinone reductase-like Zn-dependent oxidoreductase/NADP-dependent 3-hydroxy acid dehydrogenase YdfG